MPVSVTEFCSLVFSGDLKKLNVVKILQRAQGQGRGTNLVCERCGLNVDSVLDNPTGHNDGCDFGDLPTNQPKELK